MKLDKRQINALATNFYKEFKVKLDKTNKENKLKSLEKFRVDYNKGIKLLKDNKFLHSININIDQNNSVSLDKNKSFERYTNNYTFNDLLDENIKISISDIESDIILATIDSKSVEDIMKVLKSKYNKL